MGSGFSNAPIEGGSAISVATHWVEGVFFGQVGTVVAVLAVAGFGFAMLQGMVPVRKGLRILLGCFILFGAPTIAQAMLALAERGSGSPAATIEPVAETPPAPVPSPPPPTSDPYAGASVPM